jgi:hypothetical protein
VNSVGGADEVTAERGSRVHSLELLNLKPLNFATRSPK